MQVKNKFTKGATSSAELDLFLSKSRKVSKPKVVANRGLNMEVSGAQ